MNGNFDHLPPEKQQAILEAGYKVFSKNSYKKSPVSEIADAAGISKSLLFHYFRNKKALYLFLWEKCAEITIQTLTANGCYEPLDLFERMERGMKARFKIMEEYPHMAAFVIKAFYEKDPEVCGEIHASYRRHFDKKAGLALQRLDPADYRPGIDLEMMHREMYWASEGYLWEMLQQGRVDAARMEKDFKRLLAFWKQIYKRGDEENEGNCDR